MMSSSANGMPAIYPAKRSINPTGGRGPERDRRLPGAANSPRASRPDHIAPLASAHRHRRDRLSPVPVDRNDAPGIAEWAAAREEGFDAAPLPATSHDNRARRAGCGSSLNSAVGGFRTENDGWPLYRGDSAKRPFRPGGTGETGGSFGPRCTFGPRCALGSSWSAHPPPACGGTRTGTGVEFCLELRGPCFKGSAVGVVGWTGLRPSGKNRCDQDRGNGCNSVHEASRLVVVQKEPRRVEPRLTSSSLRAGAHTRVAPDHLSKRTEPAILSF